MWSNFPSPVNSHHLCGTKTPHICGYLLLREWRNPPALGLLNQPRLGERAGFCLCGATPWKLSGNKYLKDQKTV